MKRIISLITAITLLLALVVCNIPSSFAAKDQLEFKLTNAAGNNNEEITVELQISNNPGLYAFYFMLYYDTDALILRDYKLCDELTALGSLAKTDDNVTAAEYKGPVAERVIESFPTYGVDSSNKSMKLLIYEIDDVTKNFTFNGTALTLTFQVMGVAEAGDYEVGIIPDIGSIINIDAEDVPFTWTNSIVRVGSTEVPAETAPQKEHDETQKVETTETTNNDIIVISPDDTTADQTTAVETFVGEDGTTYYENEAGETVVYNEEDFVTDSDNAPESEGETSDISVDSEKADEEKEQEQKNNMTLYIIIAAILILVAVAGVLASFIFKTKKANKENDEENK